MITVLQKQYTLLLGSRDVVLNFIEAQVRADLNAPVPAYENSTICYLLVHTANAYFQWLERFAMREPIELFNDKDFDTICLIRSLFQQVDDAMYVFLQHFAEQMEIPINSTLSRNREVSATPLQVFAHVITHEFHHKGQIMSMCRMLGYAPPDTDVIRF